MLIAIEDQIQKGGEGCGGQIELSRTKLANNYHISFPTDRNEQRKIVTFLDKLFDRIGTADANTRKNLAHVRELFKSYLTSICTRDAEGWSRVSLGEIGLIRTGNTPDTSEQNNLGTYIPFIKPGDFRKGGTLDYDNEGLSEQGLTRSRLITSGSALMVCIGATIGKAGFAERDISANQQINAVIPDKGVDGKFVYYQMIRAEFQEQVIANSAQATLPIINKSRWSRLDILLPPTLRKQQHLVSELDRLAVETRKLEETYQQKLAELKRVILKKVFANELAPGYTDILPEAAE